MSRRNEIRNKEIFNPQGHGAGIWTGGGVTRTKRNRTLFVTMIPDGVNMEEVKTVFESLTGFVDFRARRRMCFVDFTTESQATQAMRKVQGHQMRPGAKGLAIDYDKDPVSKRNKNYERDRRKRTREDELESVDDYFCAVCGARFISWSKKKPLAALPRRKTDNSHVLSEKRIAELWGVKGPVKRIKREKGIEVQHTLNCKQCGISIAYRPVPIKEQTKYMYLLDAGLVETPAKRVKLDELPASAGSTATTSRLDDTPATATASASVAVSGSGSSESGGGGAGGGAGAEAPAEDATAAATATTAKADTTDTAAPTASKA